jgi:hypothetical protein
MHFLYCEDQDSVSTKLKKKQGWRNIDHKSSKSLQ